MKKLFYTAAFSLLIVAGAFGQKKVLRDAEKAFRKENVDEAIELAIQATKDPETGAETDVYLLLGQIYQQKFVQSEFADLESAQNSLDWYLKAIEVGDEKTKEDVMEQPFFAQDKFMGGGEQLGLLDYYFTTQGNNALEAQDYERAHKLLAMSSQVESTIERDFFAAYAAQQGDMMDEAYKYYKSVISYDEEYDNKPFAYNGVIQYEIDNEDFDNALMHIREAAELYPDYDTPNYKQWEVDVLVQSNKMQEAIDGLNEIIANGNADKTTYYVLSYLQWNDEQFADAEKNAMIALEMDPEYSDALYVAGSVIFNQGADMMRAANAEVDDDAKYQELKQKALDRFKEAQPLFEKALEQNPNDVYSLIPLSTIYDQLGMDAKRDELLDRIDAIEGK